MGTNNFGICYNYNYHNLLGRVSPQVDSSIIKNFNFFYLISQYLFSVNKKKTVIDVSEQAFLNIQIRPGIQDSFGVGSARIQFGAF